MMLRGHGCHGNGQTLPLWRTPQLHLAGVAGGGDVTPVGRQTHAGDQITVGLELEPPRLGNDVPAYHGGP